MESLDAAACIVDELLDFASDIGEEDVREHSKSTAAADLLPSLTLNGLPSLNVSDSNAPTRFLPESAEEDLEWISNKDAFPSLDTFVGVLPDHHRSDNVDDCLPNHHSPVSVLDNSCSNSATTSSSNNTATSNSNSHCGVVSVTNFHVPVKARSKCHRRRRREMRTEEWWWWRRQENNKKNNSSTKGVKKTRASSTGRKCQHCGSETTPQWRAGPLGPKTLCNACGVRYKSGRLVPEYRPASSPSFCSEMHSNSHRKVMEMRKKKETMGLSVVKPMDGRVHVK